MDETKAQEKMAKKLEAAGKKAEQQKAQRRERAVRGSHLTQTLLDRATAKGLLQSDKSGFVQFKATAKGPAIYVAKKGGRVDFHLTVESATIKQLTAEEAKSKHLGKVRGQLDFSKTDEEILEAYDLALTVLVNSAALPATAAPAPTTEATQAPAEAAA